ncbi:hypothetical protein O6H91_23G048500 [Diphasiastrum complanatum]|uniref:Uncharacterized protein n=10 Tax=Diphasiastrum complanatum TaxID=34168 RepID=A0ACC2AAH9_DIPCM|nr:hypothetical protein O6H91_23G020000 [Diphasiastrum complanatum]KAJ7513930.1 hypothetical protein O6H91_23G020000 [Diphasiastrum complanatum]KAJ7513931.1 hypothetical protein O6H91_23G020000 [Diphasiastrum complanatum]KAJ7513933.1 hypothetical protein O6H91_23G020000 [Diphasiastrum complanatum]KAJ7513934.1 hypothetical protein O6H91_23G020000 [Diphasiastrum complanatum]
MEMATLAVASSLLSLASPFDPKSVRAWLWPHSRIGYCKNIAANRLVTSSATHYCDNWNSSSTRASYGPQGAGAFSMDPASVLQKERIIFLGSQVDDMSADVIISQLLLLDSQDPTKDIKLLINSPGGSVTAGMGIYDAMKLCKADVSTICFGLAASMGAFLLASGTKGKRFCMPNSRVMIHQPLGGGSGSAIDVGIQAREMMYHKIKLTKIMSRLTGKSEQQIEVDTDRDYFMNAWEAVEYGLVDAVVDDGKPGLVAPVGEAKEPPKTRIWDYWTVKERKERKALPLEAPVYKDSEEKHQAESEEREKAAV